MLSVWSVTYSTRSQVMAIPQYKYKYKYKYNILVTQVQGKAEDAGNN